MIRLGFSVTGVSYLCKMRVLTPDQLEQALLQEEANIARSRARQMQLIHLADAMQLPMPTDVGRCESGSPAGSTFLEKLPSR